MPYENSNSFGPTYGEHKEALELSFKDYYELKRYADYQDIIFCASGWDEESIDFLDDLGVLFFKMASADLTNFPLLRHTAKKGKPLFLSTGMSTMEQVQAAFSMVSEINSQIALLQCTSTYPSKFNEINLNVLHTFRKEFPNAVIGFSGHELGIAIPPVATALGARIIERHFTLDRTMKGGDHVASLEPQGFAKMVRDIRHVEEAMGSFQKEIQPSEFPIFRKLAKSIVSKVAIPKGMPLRLDMLTTKGPGTGISPTRIEQVIGKIVNRDIEEDEVITEEYIAC
ncbi:MAG: N-acetylneuraminate synthase family protein [Cyclobacteriaceae bacterium]|nr:N-acetylneuraminate synthase family protein [Cyclobacteriaceae bacterium]